MPSKSPAQHKLMQAVAHNPAFAKKTGIPTKVGKEFAKIISFRIAQGSSKEAHSYLIGLVFQSPLLASFLLFKRQRGYKFVIGLLL